MSTSSVLGDPPDAEELARRRKAAGSAEDAAFTAFMSCPVPLLDLAVGAGAMAYDEASHGAERAAPKAVHGAAARDWSATRTPDAYVAKARARGRDLTTGEVEALEARTRGERMVAGGVAAAAGAVTDALFRRGGTAPETPRA